MSLTTPPAAIAVGPAVQVSPPSNAPWGSLVLDNLSPYLLEIQIGGQYEWLAPWTENVYKGTSTHAPVTISAQVPTGVALLSGASSQIQATWFDPGEELPPRSWPVSLTASAISGLTTVLAPPPQTLFGPTSIVTATGSIQRNVAVPPTIRTLIVLVAVTAGGVVQALDVLGNTSGVNYYNQSPYLGAHTGTGYTFAECIVPVPSVADPTVLVSLTFSAAAATATLTVLGDTILYREDEFYNGIVQVSAVQPGATGSGLLVAGPRRLLTLNVDASVVGSGIVVVNGAGSNLIRADAGASGSSSINFPGPGQILELGDSLSWVATVAGGGLCSASLTSTYP